MRWLTYNLWHGLAPGPNLWEFVRLEPDSQRESRRDLALDLIRDLKPDVAFLQEVNPLRSWGGQLAESLDLDGFFKEDSVGVKVLRMGLPSEIQSGLTVLTRKSLGARKSSTLRLSGDPYTMTGDLISFQLSEARYAVMVEWIDSLWGRVLAINLHLHHGLEFTSDLRRRFRDCCTEYRVSDLARLELERRLESGDLRRKYEMANLLGWISRYEGRYGLVVVGGDWNADSPGHLDTLAGFGFTTALTSEGLSYGCTFSPGELGANDVFAKNFPMTVSMEDLGLSVEQTIKLHDLFYGFERRPRRIDQIWFKSLQPNLSVEIKDSRVVGRPKSVEGIAPSDHFGLVVDTTFVMKNKIKSGRKRRKIK